MTGYPGELQVFVQQRELALDLRGERDERLLVTLLGVDVGDGLYPDECLQLCNDPVADRVEVTRS